MYNKLKLFGVCFLLLFLSCKNKIDKKVNNNNDDVAKLKSYCQIPLEIENYLNKNRNLWYKIDLDNFDKELLDYLSGHLRYEDNQTCPYFVYGDFNHNEEKDFAIIVGDVNRQDEEDDFASLLIFHDYESNFTPPSIPLKDAADTENAMIKTAIYSVREYGVLSYLEKGDICGISVLDINYFEKSGFYVYWNKEKKKYQFLPSYETEEILCDIIKGNRSKYIAQWQGTYSFDFGGVQMGEEFEGSVSFKIDDKSSKVSFTNSEELLNIVKATKDTLQLQNSDGDIYKIYKDEQGNFNVSGHPIYMLNPPNESYLLTKGK